MTHDHTRHAPAGHPNAAHAVHAENLPNPAPTWDSLVMAGSPVEPQHPQPSPQPAAPAGAHLMPSGHWVVMGDPHTLTRADKRELIRISREQTDGAETMFAVTDWLHRRLITAWSYDLPLPSADPDSLGRLPLVDDDAMDELIGEANKLLFPGPVTPDDHADPNSPTAPSGE